MTLHDALLLAFAEIEAYGIATVAGAEGTVDVVRADLVRTLRERAPHGLGSYAFWLRRDEDRFAAGAAPVLHTSGAEVDRALSAALAHQGLAVRACGRLVVQVPPAA